MNPFIATVLINGLTANYEIFPIGKKFKAILVQSHLAKHIPYQLDFWKENQEWKTYHPLTQEAIDQFGNTIDNQMRTGKAENFENPSAA